jgi:hypothetical protein
LIDFTHFVSKHFWVKRFTEGNEGNEERLGQDLQDKTGFRCPVSGRAGVRKGFRFQVSADTWRQHFGFFYWNLNTDTFFYPKQLKAPLGKNRSLTFFPKST